MGDVGESIWDATNPLGHGGLNALAPGSGFIHEGATGGFGEVGSYLADPLDLFGQRAKQTRDQVSGIQQQSAADAIAAQEEMRKIIDELLAPYRTQGEQALPDFAAMASTGQANVPLSPQYLYQRDIGLQNINRGAAARGRRYSTSRDNQVAGFLNQLGQEEANRVYGRNLDTLKLGLNALSTLGGANAVAGQNIGNAFSNLASGANANIANYGQSRQQSLSSAGTALQGLANYLAYQGK